MTDIDASVARLNEAGRKEPIDWETIRSEAFGLDAVAKNKDQEAAVRQLKGAWDAVRIGMAAKAVQRAFLPGKPGADGWPRRY